MYWDGCVLDALQPTKGILIASSHPEPVAALIQLVNKMTDLNGNPYDFEMKTWKDEGVKYPRNDQDCLGRRAATRLSAQSPKAEMSAASLKALPRSLQ